jgi:hypothetical protein
MSEALIRTQPDISQSEMDEVKDLLNLDSYDRFIKYAQRNNQLDLTEFISDFHNLRKMGMERDQAALLCGITPNRLQSLLYGIGISEEDHSRLLAAEVKANAAFEKFHLSLITKHSKNDWRASGWLLERIGPKRYKPVTKVQQDVTIVNPHTAVNELARLRAEQNIQVNVQVNGSTGSPTVDMQSAQGAMQPSAREYNELQHHSQARDVNNQLSPQSGVVSGQRQEGEVLPSSPSMSKGNPVAYMPNKMPKQIMEAIGVAQKKIRRRDQKRLEAGINDELF